MSYFSQSNKQAFRNPWVVGWLLLLLVVLLVNFGMITTAFMTSPGLVKEDYYEQGKDYERTVLQLIEARQRLGWKVNLDAGVVKVGVPALLEVRVSGKTGEAVAGLSGYLQVYRPSDKKQDMVVSVTEVEPGVYHARYTVLLKGVWDLLLTMEQGTDQYTVEQRVHAGE
ncbi:MAG: FixH family protein [Gammaproteobacteria bacterium]|jgi:nitrogen fixation protein FixH|nr:FixH family protein [Gammaproteobacteria bacterium]MBT7306684.1 FixH family protein [Gammaproteobacteria bacterium]